MAAGEYIGSKSQREILDAQIHEERHEVEERPGEAEAEVAYMLTEEGLDEEEAARIAGTDGAASRGAAADDGDPRARHPGRRARR